MILCIAALMLFFIAVVLSGRMTGRFAFVPGTISVFAVMLNVYGFGLGLAGFSETGRKHRTCIAGSIINGILLVGWIGLYQLGR